MSLIHTERGNQTERERKELNKLQERAKNVFRNMSLN